MTLRIAQPYSYRSVLMRAIVEGRLLGVGREGWGVECLGEEESQGHLSAVCVDIFTAVYIIF